jgi:diguanylate cyclase (GGDEF)-like protein
MDKSFTLIVQSEQNSSDTFKNVLAKAGFQTEVVFNEAQVFERISARMPWLIILDLDHAGHAGGHILEKLRKGEKLRQIKVIAVTSYPQIAESLSVEPDLLLFKPVGSEQFADLLERFQLKLKYQTTIPMIGEPWDRVTGVYNQAFFMELLGRSLLLSKETDNHKFAVLAVSFDQDNRVKDQLEIKNWITALRAAAEILGTTVRPTDTVARFDQDNFHILIDNIPDQDIPRMVASRIYKNLKEKLATLGYKVQFTVRIGILICDQRYENIEAILEDADAARSLGHLQGEFLAENREHISVML